MKWRPNLFELAALCGTLFTAPAFAQLEEIVVTAQKRSENLQDVPIAISVVTGQSMLAAGVSKVEDLGVTVPGFSLTREGAATELYIRGVGSTGGAAGQESGVATFVDGVYMPAQTGATFAFNNVEQIEVLKGPQGTLYGRNATGGAMNITTPTPSHTAALQAEVGQGNLNTTSGRLYATSGLTDAIAADLAVTYSNQKDGFGTNLATGDAVDYDKDFGVRSKLLVEPGEGTKIILSADYGYSDGTVGTGYRNYGAGSRQFITGVDGWPYGFWNISNDMDPFYRVIIAGGSAKLEQLFDAMKFTSITAFRTSKADQRFDIDETALPLFGALILEHDEQFTQEFQLSSATDHINWIVGAFFLDGSAKYTPWQVYGTLFAPASTEIVNSTQKTTSYALFGQSTFKLSESTNLTVGARYTTDERHLEGTGVLVLLDGLQVPPFPDQDRSKTFSAPTWRLSLDHRLSQDVMIYGSYNRGFQSGIFNLGGNVITSNPVNPETLDAFETGLKSTLFDERLRLNTAAFYYLYKNLQLPIIEDGTQVIVNATRARMYGLDADFDAALTHALSIRGGGEFLHGEYRDFPDAPITIPNNTFPYGNILTVGNASGNRLIYTPDYSFTITADYHFALAGGVLSNSTTFAYNGGFYWEPNNRLKQPAYGLLNGQVKWTAPGGKYYVRAYGSNLLNKEYFVMGQSSALGDIGAAAPGRTYGLAAGVSF